MKKKLFLILIICSAIIMTFTAFGRQVVPVSVNDNVNSVKSTGVESITLKINGQHLDSFYAPVVINGVTIVPLRDVMEMLGWNVKWIEETEEIVITRDENEILLKIGSDKMAVDGKETTLSVAPAIIGEITYVPLRAVAEALNALVGWESENSTAAIYTGDVVSTLTIASYSVKVGSSVNELISVCGQPTYKMTGDKGLLWYVYAKYPAAFMAVATDGGVVCGYYTNSKLFAVSEGYSYGDTAPENEGESKLINGNGYSIELFYDKKVNSIYGVRCMLDGYSSIHDEVTALANQSKMGLDILNSFRYSQGKNPLVWNDYAAESCTAHSYYMASSGVLTHKGIDGSSAIDRYLEVNPKAKWRAWGELISDGKDIFTCMNDWINTDYYRSIMLSDKTDAGIGFAYLPKGKYEYCASMLLIK